MVRRTTTRPSIAMSQMEATTEAATIAGSVPHKEYRALSVLAMLAFGMGLLSSLAVFAPILGVFAVVAIAVGMIALRHIHLNSDRLSGRWLAVAPLILAPLFLGWGVTREFSRRERFLTHAREFADDWLSMLNRNEPYFAHQLKVAKKLRLDSHMNFEVAYQRDEMATGQFKLFVESIPVKDILAAAPLKFEFEEYLRSQHSGLTDVVTLQYSYQASTLPKTRFWVSVRRDFSSYTGTADWQITEISSLRPRGS